MSTPDIGLNYVDTVKVANYQAHAIDILLKIIHSEAKRTPDFLAYYKKQLLDLKVYTNEIERINKAAQNGSVQPKGR